MWDATEGSVQGFFVTLDSLYKNAMFWPASLPIPSGAAIAASMRNRIYVHRGANVWGGTIPSPEDLLAHIVDDESAPIKVHLPNAVGDERFTGIKGGSIVRSHESAALATLPTMENNSWNPVTMAYAKMLRVCGRSLCYRWRRATSGEPLG